MDPEGDCDILEADDPFDILETLWKRSMDPEGDCDNPSFYFEMKIGKSSWKRSMDPEGDCDITIGLSGF